MILQLKIWKEFDLSSKNPTKAKGKQVNCQKLLLKTETNKKIQKNTMPPPLGVGVKCELLLSGKANNEDFFTSLQYKGISKKDAIKLIENKDSIDIFI